MIKSVSKIRTPENSNMEEMMAFEVNICNIINHESEVYLGSLLENRRG